MIWSNKYIYTASPLENPTKPLDQYLRKKQQLKPPYPPIPAK